MADRVLVDNNIVIPYLLTQPDSQLARELYVRYPVWLSESFQLVELSNVLVTYVRNELLDIHEAEVALERAIALFGTAGLVTVENRDSIRMAARYKTSAYDARYLVLAERYGLKLVTQDKQLRAAAPDLTQSLDEALAQ